MLNCQTNSTNSSKVASLYISFRVGNRGECQLVFKHSRGWWTSSVYRGKVWTGECWVIHLLQRQQQFSIRILNLINIFLLIKIYVNPQGIYMHYLNSLWPSDAIWWQGSRSTLVQVMACCLTAPSHYLNQCWLCITKVQWCLSEGNFAWDITAISH